MERTPERWRDTVRLAGEMFAEAGVIVQEWHGSIGDVTSIIDGKHWNP